MEPEPSGAASTSPVRDAPTAESELHEAVAALFHTLAQRLQPHHAQPRLDAAPQVLHFLRLLLSIETNAHSVALRNAVDNERAWDCLFYPNALRGAPRTVTPPRALSASLSRLSLSSRTHHAAGRSSTGTLRSRTTLVPLARTRKPDDVNPAEITESKSRLGRHKTTGLRSASERLLRSASATPPLPLSSPKANKSTTAAAGDSTALATDDSTQHAPQRPQSAEPLIERVA